MNVMTEWILGTKYHRKIISSIKYSIQTFYENQYLEVDKKITYIRFTFRTE